MLSARGRRFGAAFAVLLPATAVGAGTPMYSASELYAYRQRVAPIVEDTFARHIVGSLPPDQRAAASRIGIEFPDPPFGGTPLEFSASGKTIAVPIASMRFIDDLFILRAWFDRHGCPQENIESYLSMALVSPDPVQPPLAAFGIDRDVAIADPEVNDASNPLLTVTVLFLLGHEAGHILLGHRTDGTARQSQSEEVAADAFALDRFAELGVLPAAVSFYFAASAWLETDPSAGQRSTHPLSGARLNAIAERFERCPECFTSSLPNPAAATAALASLPSDLRQLGDLIESSAFVQQGYVLRTLAPEAKFKSICPSG